MVKPSSYRLPEKTLQEISFLANQLGISKTAVIILAIRRFARAVKRQQAEKGKE